jgi:dipeptidyl aminopeptidase/acylaminoacyl peptidase
MNQDFESWVIKLTPTQRNERESRPMKKRIFNPTLMFIFLLLSACGTIGQEPSISPTVTAQSTASAATSEGIQVNLLPTETPFLLKTLDPSPTIRPNENTNLGRIAFYAERDGNPEIYTMNPDGTDQRRLTFNEFEDSSLVWSPDGTRIAFISDREDPQAGKCLPNCFYQVYVINADGTNEQKLFDTEFSTLHPDWHPEGTMISFDTEFNFQGDIYTINTDGSDVRLLIEEGFWADWSPDGTQIAFVSKRDGDLELYLADADGSNQRRLTENQRMEFFPAWSPDGKKIAFMSGQPPRMQIYIMNVDGGDEQQLTSVGHVNEDPDWSPDGRYIIFQSNRDGNFEIYRLEVEAILRGEVDYGLLRLTNSSRGDYWPAWNPEITAQSVSSCPFQKSDQTFPSVPTYEIGLADLDQDGNLDAVFANGQSNDSQVWLNDGRGFFTDTGQQMGKYGHGIDVGDIDGDGDTDVILSTHSNSEVSRVYLNDGNALFQELEGALDANVGFSVKLLDIDGDGDLDAVGESISETNIYLNDGEGYFSSSEITLPLTNVWGDLDSDGDIDVFTKEDGVGYSVRINDGKGNFKTFWNHTDTTAMLLGDMALGDVDNDGDLDAIITNGHYQSTSYPTLVFINDGTGQFTDSGQRLSAVRNAGIGLGDLDGDGDLDFVLTDYQEPNQIWLNDGGGQFVDSDFRFGGDQFYRHVHLADLDGDGDLDIFLATFGLVGGPNEIWFNQGFEN